MRAAALGMVLLCGIAQGAEPKTVTNTIGMKLIQIPAGTFTMGSRSDEQGHSSDEGQVKVTLTKPFRLGKTEVTQGQWKKVMGTEPWAAEGLDKLRKVRDVRADKDCPATYVSWADARQFCDKLTELERKIGKLTDSEEYRLPTEAEWEYACRAGTETAYPFADDAKQLGDYGWFEAPPHKVGTKKPNPWGLHDMHGNVSEWCSDWYGEKLSGDADPVGPERGSSRVFRGGSVQPQRPPVEPGRLPGWSFRDPDQWRTAARSRNGPSNRSDDLGFRVARSQSAQ